MVFIRLVGIKTGGVQYRLVGIRTGGVQYRLVEKILYLDQELVQCLNMIIEKT